jgi:hypothetical protein
MFPYKEAKYGSPALIFTIIALWYAVTNFIWWHINTPVIPWYDTAAVHFLDVFKNETISPPLIPWIMRFMFFLFGKEQSDLIIIAVNYVFFLIPLYFIYKIGEKTDSKETGQIAMILFAMVPAVYGLSRQFGHKDYHVIAAITFNIYCLIKTDHFKNRKWAILYGISAGLGLLIKEYFLAYFIPPFLWILFKAFKEKPRSFQRINIILASLIGILVSGIYYFDFYAIHKVLNDPVVQTRPVFSFSTIKIMMFGLYEELLSLPIFLVYLAGLWYFISRYRNKHKIIILLWIFVPWTIIFLMPHYKVSEYCAGFIPAMILIGAIFITHIKKNTVKEIILAALIIVGIIQHIDFSFFQKSILSTLGVTINQTFFPYYRVDYKNIMNCNAKDNSQKIVQLVDFINKVCQGSKLSVYVNDNAVINSKAFRSAMLLQDMRCLPKDIEKFNLKKDQNAIVLVGEMPVAMKKNKKKINREFYMAATTFFYNNIKDESNKIRIFKRKINN